MKKTSINSTLSDREAKNVLLEKWHECPTNLWTAPNNGAWLRALPKVGKTTVPCLKSPGTKEFKTQPDGLYVCVQDGKYADVIAIEVCGSLQNLNDKRSRYAPNLSSLMLYLPESWLCETTSGKGGSKKQRWERCHGISDAPTDSIEVPIRHVRVLYALPNDLLKKWRLSHSPQGHEFFCRHSSLKAITQQDMRVFLKRMSIDQHFHGVN